jgi:hypothetical protein
MVSEPTVILVPYAEPDADEDSEFGEDDEVESESDGNVTVAEPTTIPEAPDMVVGI